MIARFSAALSLLFVAFSAPIAQADPGDQAPVDFTRDIRPILTGKCFTCHGPDEKARKAGLRLDLRDAALKPARSGQTAIVPGQPDKSELLTRITSDIESVRMPPMKAGKPLSPAEIQLFKRWIEQGANYAQHWAFVKPRRPAVPEIPDKTWTWAVNPIDHFILERLQKEGLRPTVELERHALARRVALDLTGLPPTLEEAERFVQDRKPDAYERYVDRMLAKPAYGERWGQAWLDMARYADSQGYANDPDRTIWRWRDWVIQALNDNMPYDRFTLEQLAGDLLPNPTPAQLTATGFHRNTLTNTEGGTDPEEFRSMAVVDRVNTTFQVWMGVTMACAQCHDHKYDPILQKEYFQVYAILNSCEDANGGNDSPTVTTAVVGKEKEFETVNARLEEARKKLDAETKTVDAQQAEWEKTVDPAKLPKELADLLAKPADKRDKKLLPKLQAYHRAQSESWKKLDAEVKELTARFAQVGTTTPILRELKKPRVTNIQIRGNFLAKGEQVTPGLPAAFPGPKEKEPMDRLTLARWLVSPDNPLTARVAVNRLWEEIFGVGLVLTSEDFGIQGEPPSHPELLDWLATEYVRLSWDTKKMLKLMVMSATYRQSSQASAELAKRDPFNRLLARGPRVRLSAEAVRDQALFAAGLLSTKMYGPPVQPPRPTFGLSAAFGSSTDWQPSNGEDRYRRALYTRWRRNAPYPSMTTFDTPERTFCNIRRLRTNTPLQALVTLNDPVYVEAAQGLARRIVSQDGDTTAKVTFAFRTVLIRPPTEKETQRLVDLFDQARTQYEKDPAKALALATKPLGAAPKDMNVTDLAAWTVVANVLLNLDETLAKR
jgi:Protein of unknown function (DUF1553)/Protein of unknown function (DUF1549)/Planctomycete cytochrome C